LNRIQPVSCLDRTRSLGSASAADGMVATGDIDQGKLLAIGTGIILGAAAGSLVTLRGAALVGAIAGGLIGAWWYGNHSDIAPLEPRKR
jgi:hypothetical protein